MIATRPSVCARACLTVGLALVACGEDQYGNDQSPVATPPLSWVVVSPAAASLVSGDSVSFSATSNSPGLPTWSSTDSATATIHSPVPSTNRVTIVALDKAGSVSICAKFSSVVVGCSVVQVTRE